MKLASIHMVKKYWEAEGCLARGLPPLHPTVGFHCSTTCNADWKHPHPHAAPVHCLPDLTDSHATLQGSCSLALVKHVYYFVFTDALTCHTCWCWRAVPPSQGQSDIRSSKGSTLHKQTIRTEATASSEKLLCQVMTPGPTSNCPSYLRGQTTGVSAHIQQPIGTVHISKSQDGASYFSCNHNK